MDGSRRATEPQGLLLPGAAAAVLGRICPCSNVTLTRCGPSPVFQLEGHAFLLDLGSIEVARVPVAEHPEEHLPERGEIKNVRNAEADA